MTQHRDASKERRWLELILLWQKSKPKLTVREFCERRHVSEQDFYNWKRVLRQRGLLQDPQHSHPTMASATPMQPAFVKLTLDAATEPATPTAVDLVLSERRLLRVRPGFDPAMLLQLVRLLEEPAC